MNYFTAVTAAVVELKHGRAKAYSVDWTRETGKRIYLESDQGWNPDPFWQECTEPHYSQVADLLGG